VTSPRPETAAWHERDRDGQDRRSRRARELHQGIGELPLVTFAEVRLGNLALRHHRPPMCAIPISGWGPNDKPVAPRRTISKSRQRTVGRCPNLRLQMQRVERRAGLSSPWCACPDIRHEQDSERRPEWIGETSANTHQQPARRRPCPRPPVPLRVQANAKQHLWLRPGIATKQQSAWR
jgi:hypothetical protein